MSVLMLITVLLSFNAFASSEMYHISPTEAAPCPTANCITLSQFVDTKSAVNNQQDSNVTLLFESGKHSFTSDFLIESITEFSMLSNSSSTTISCEQSARWSFFFLFDVQISGLTFIECSFQVYSVTTFTVNNSAFSNHSGNSVIDIWDSSAYITDSYFQSNSGGMLKVFNNKKVASGAVILASQSKMEFCGSMFEANNAIVGGVMFTELHSNITFINCSFVENHATTNGGVLYSDEGCTITVYNCTYANNSARVHGGVFTVISSNLSIYKSLFSSNKAEQSDGGVISAKSKDGSRDVVVTISASNFTNNSAFAGGVVITFYTMVMIKDNSYFENNRAKLGGGVVFFDKSSLQINDSIFFNNAVEYNGGVVYTSDAELSIYNALFIGNTAENGGVMGMERTNVTINNSDFSHNSASVAGGAIVLELTNHIDISRCTFTVNFAYGGGVIFSSDKTLVKNNDVLFKNNTASQGIMYFIDSSATFTGTTTVVNNSGSLLFYYSSVVFKGITTVANNLPYYNNNISQLNTTSSEGGGITAFQSTVDFDGVVTFKQNSATNGGAISLVSSKLNVLGNTSMFQNTATDSGGGVYLYQSELICKTMSYLTLLENNATERGGGIHAISSVIILEYGFFGPKSVFYTGSKLSLISNVAMSFGGGICFENDAKFKVFKNFSRFSRVQAVLFNGNTAKYGGALYVADDTTSGTCSAGNSHGTYSTVSECFFQTSTVEKVTTLNDPGRKPRIKYVHTKFTNNHALVRGSNLFGGLLDRCTQSPFNEIIKTQLSNTGGLENLLLFSNISTSIDSISSKPVKVCFCYQNKPNCQDQQFSIKVRKGEKFEVPLVAVDQVQNVISATIHSLPKSNKSGVGEGQLIQNIADSCTNLTFNVFTPKESEELILYADGPCKDAPLSLKRVQINFSSCSCSTGFQVKHSEQTKCVCECDSKLDGYISSCNYETITIMKNGNSWITYVSTLTNYSDYVIYPYCPLDYCKDYSERTNINLNTANGIDTQCAQFRTGTLCSACQSNFSLSLGSSRCILCPNYWPVDLIIILIASLLAGIILVALILVLNLTVAVGTLNGVIFYANIINANIRTFFPSSQPSFFSVFISWLNLDIGLDICLFPTMDAYWKTWLQLVFPTYVLLLVVIVIVISERSKRFSQLIGKKNPVATLATLILLSYAKLLHTIIAALSVAVLKYPGSNGGCKVRLWLPDATVEYLKGKHIALFIAAIVILLVGVVYTTLLFAWQWLVQFHENKLFCWTRNQKLHLFISETYQAPYTPRNRYWTGLLLFARVILYTASAANISGDPKVALLMTGFITLVLLLIHQFVGMGNHVYKKWPVETLEVTCHINLALLCLATFFGLESMQTRTVVTSISISITFALLLGVLVYHIFTELIAKVCKKCLPFLRLARRPLERNNDKEMCLPTRMTVDGPKGPVKYNPQLRETLLDYCENDTLPTY